ncbi:hypothetical protein ACU686_32580 [Yinghuangia aomiensis]
MQPLSPGCPGWGGERGAEGVGERHVLFLDVDAATAAEPGGAGPLRSTPPLRPAPDPRGEGAAAPRGVGEAAAGLDVGRRPGPPPAADRVRRIAFGEDRDAARG